MHKAKPNQTKNNQHQQKQKCNRIRFAITTVVIEGDPKSVILEEAETFDADLIVVGSHGCGFVERFLLGSVSHEVSLHAKCSVLIVRK